MSDNQLLSDSAFKDDSNGSTLRTKTRRFRRKLGKVFRSKKEKNAVQDSAGRLAIDFQVTNFQQQSPLFGLLPGEIRNDIFAYALAYSEDSTEAYEKDKFWYRPGFIAPHKANSALLRTCKLAYVEGQKVFVSESEWAFWFDHGRGPPERTGLQACRKFFETLGPEAVGNLKRVHFFTQLFWLEPGINLQSLFSMPQFRPEQLTITIRYSDWWYWEYNEPLHMDETWLRYFKGSPGLRKLIVEYESLNWKKDEMLRIIQRNKKWKLPVRRSGGSKDDIEGYLCAEDQQLKEWKWTGTSKLDGAEWSHHGKGDTVEYMVVTDTWKFVEGELKSEEA